MPNFLMIMLLSLVTGGFLHLLSLLLGDAVTVSACSDGMGGRQEIVGRGRICTTEKGLLYCYGKPVKTPASSPLGPSSSTQYPPC